jgi:hypothetical protein
LTNTLGLPPLKTASITLKKTVILIAVRNASASDLTPRLKYLMPAILKDATATTQQSTGLHAPLNARDHAYLCQVDPKNLPTVSLNLASAVLNMNLSSTPTQIINPTDLRTKTDTRVPNLQATNKNLSLKDIRKRNKEMKKIPINPNIVKKKTMLLPLMKTFSLMPLKN